MADNDTLALNSALECSPLDTSAEEAMVLCVLPRADGTASRYAVPEAVMELLRLFDGTRALQQVASEYALRYPGRHSEESIEKLVNGFLVPKRLLLRGSGTGAEHAPADTRRSILFLRTRLLSGRTVYPIARALGWMFSRPVFVLWVGMVLWVHWRVYGQIAPAAGLDLAQVTGSDLLLLAAITTVSVFIHELGHAAAAVHYGCRNTEIGWGVYLYFSVFYTDVSEAWKLPREQRAVVDMSGIYFQSVFMALLLAAYHATGDVIWLYGILASDVGIAHSLNPFLRMDGYWLLSDLFGIVNLQSHMGKLLRVGLGKLAAPFVPVRVPAWTLARRSTWILAVYTAFSLGFFIYIYLVLARFVVASLIRSFPVMLNRLYGLMAAGSPDLLAIGGATFEVLWRAVILSGAGFFLYRLMTGVVRWLGAAREMFAAGVAQGVPARGAEL
jgi:putative peptide zinc metalloprotease protein